MGIMQYRLSHLMTAEQLYATIDTKSDGRIDEQELLSFFGNYGRPSMNEANAKMSSDMTEKLSDEKLTKWFVSLAEGTDRSVPKDCFMNMLRLFMTVSKAADVGVFMNSEEGQQLRQLEAGEYVEVLEGPRKEDEDTIKRVRARAVKDGLEGLVAYSRSDGSPF